MVREFKKVCTTTEFECYLYVSLCSLISSFNEVNDPQIHCLLGSLPTKIAYTLEVNVAIKEFHVTQKMSLRLRPILRSLLYLLNPKSTIL